MNNFADFSRDECAANFSYLTPSVMSDFYQLAQCLNITHEGMLCHRRDNLHSIYFSVMVTDILHSEASHHISHGFTAHDAFSLFDIEIKKNKFFLTERKTLKFDYSADKWVIENRDIYSKLAKDFGIVE